MDKKSLMIVDDSAMMRHFLRTKVSEGFPELHLETANDGMECVGKIENRRHDFVFLDLVMPRMGGLDALKKIREIDASARVIMVSAVNQKDKLEESIMAGASDFIVKPFDKTRLKALLGKILAE